ncbi:MAG: peptidylprolyl isomerase [Clostridiales bacterium]|nr:peptidylprolyl isomerase [Clostridiales bacterium]
MSKSKSKGNKQNQVQQPSKAPFPVKQVSIIVCIAVLVLAVAGWCIWKGCDDAAVENVRYVEITVQDYGTMVAELYPDVAPITVENFLKLTNQGFYDGLTFHRIISGFMIQGGDPTGTGSGGSDEYIKGEFAANGVKNELSHARGVLSMARAQAYDSARSQFFIMHEDNPGLDGQYAAFGKVISGIEVVDAICKDTPTGYNGAVEAADQPVITSVREIEKP